MAKVNDDDKIHVGIENVKKRLNDMSGGTLKIESVIGEGTRVTMIIPQK